MGKNLGPYDRKSNSCVAHVVDVARAGGVDAPKGVLSEFKFLKKNGF